MNKKSLIVQFTSLEHILCILLLLAGISNIMASGEDQECLIQGAQNMQLSMDAGKIAYIKPREEKTVLFLYDIKTETISQITRTETEIISAFWWVSNKKIAYTTKGGELFIFDVESKQTTLANLPAIYELVFLKPVLSGAFYVSVKLKGEIFFEIYSISEDSGDATLIMKNPGNIFVWVLDDHGKPSYALGATSGRKIVYKISSADDASTPKFIPLCSSRIEAEYRILHAQDGYGYILTNFESDTASVYHFRPDCSNELIYNNELYDLSNAYFDKTSTIYCVSYVGDENQYVFLDNDEHMLRNVIEHFKGMNIYVISMDANDRRMIVGVAKADGPRKYYLYDNDKKTPLLLTSDNFDEANYINSKPFSFISRDGLKIHGYFTPPRLQLAAPPPAVILVHGGFWERDLFQPDANVQWLARHGVAVIRLNYRGSTGYGKNYEIAGSKQFGLNIQNDITDGVMWLVQNNMIDKNRIAIMGFSFGGYSAMQNSIINPDFYKCAISILGIVDVFSLTDHTPMELKLENENTKYRCGDPRTDAEILRQISPIYNYEKITTPLLMFRGAKDFRNATVNYEPMVANLNERGVECIYTVYEDEEHSILSKANQNNMLRIIMYFLRKYLGLHENNNFGSNSTKNQFKSFERIDISSSLNSLPEINSKKLINVEIFGTN